MKIKHKLLSVVYQTFDKLGYELRLRKKIYRDESDTYKTKINIGAGKWGNEGWINLDYPSETYKKAQSHHSFMPYDIRSDKLPFGDDQVDLAYCSHVIEHIEDEYIEHLIYDVYRALKQGGGVQDYVS